MWVETKSEITVPNPAFKFFFWSNQAIEQSNNRTIYPKKILHLHSTEHKANHS